jgi:Flp pilus assembly protein TadD
MMKGIFMAAALLAVLGLSAPPAAAEASAELEALWLQGETLVSEGNVDEALEVFSRALEADRDQPRSWNYIGGIHFLRGDYMKALLDFRQAFELDPRDARACNNIATAYEHLGRFEEAETYYLRAMEIDDAYPVPYRNLGILYAEHLGRPKMARTYWEKFLKLVPLGPGSDDIRQALDELDREGRTGGP